MPIYYESGISKLSLNAAELRCSPRFKEITEGEELTKKEKLKTKWAALEALVGDPQRVALVAAVFYIIACEDITWRNLFS